MDATRTNELRAVIWALHVEGIGPTEIARRLGCGRTVVQKTLKEPGPDRRTRRGRRLDPAAAGAGLAATGGRPRLARGPDPYRDVGAADYAQAARAGPGLGHEASYARALLRQILEELQDTGRPLGERHRLRADAARLLGALARLERVPGGLADRQARAWLAQVARDKTRAKRKEAQDG
jgi:hypothetical protein